MAYGFAAMAKTRRRARALMFVSIPNRALYFWLTALGWRAVWVPGPGLDPGKIEWRLK